ncbi:MAG: hypothetical protein LPJ94_13920, partial [Thauera sp.]|nr:hypothetical protein [Thauera sp.]
RLCTTNLTSSSPSAQLLNTAEEPHNTPQIRSKQHKQLRRGAQYIETEGGVKRVGDDFPGSNPDSITRADTDQ